MTMLDRVPEPHLGDRSPFAQLQYNQYWNHAAMSPLATDVADAMRACIESFTNYGSSAWLRWAEQRTSLRGKLAELAGARSADDIGLTGNTSHGVQAIALGFPWRARDRVMLLRGEFPSNVTPWQRAAELFDLELVWGDVEHFSGGSTRGLEELENTLRSKRVRVVAVSAVQFQTGLRMPLTAIGGLCHTHGAELFVDGIQAAGALPLDLAQTPVDYFAAGSHKWLNGPEGGGFLYIHPDRRAALRPALASWLSHEDAATFLFAGPGHLDHERPIRTDSAALVESGLVPSLVFAGLEVAVDRLLALGPSNVYQHVQNLHDLIEPRLTEHGFESVRESDPESRSGILSFRPPHDAPPLATMLERLEERGVAAASPDGFFRLSPHWPNDATQVDELIAACARARIS